MSERYTPVGPVMRMLRWFIVAALAVSSARGAEVRPADAVPVFHCTFDESWDVNFDSWPDRWIRMTGPEYPHYVKIAIRDDESAANKKCLQFDLDGAAAAVATPPILVLSRFSYLFEAMLKTEGLKNSAVTITLDFSDSAGRVLFSESSKPITITKDWQKISLGPLEPGNPNIDRVTIRITVARGSKGDLMGHVALADVWLARLPRIAVSTDNPCNVYESLDEVVVHCELTGIRERDPEIRFQLFDALNREIDAANFRLNGRSIVDKQQPSTNGQGGQDDSQNGFEGTEKWHPKIPDYGFYRVAVKMLSSESAGGHNDAERQLGNGTVWLAVVPPLPVEKPKQGEFGWTLPTADHPLSFQELSRLLRLVGINWVKLPVWFDAQDPRRGDDLIRFVELLSASYIEVVGIIDHPPATDSATHMDPNTSIADVLLDTSSPWLASLEPVMTRLSLRVRWWQLGRDFDTSFADASDLVKRIENLRTVLFRFGQDVRLGINWDWEKGSEIPGETSWDFEQLCIHPQPSEQKFAELLATNRNNTAQPWIFVEPPPRLPGELATDEAAQAARASEFVRRLVLAKVQGAQQIIVSEPFHDEHGLMRENGMPGELLLPWRTTAVMLGGAKYLGQMTLPAGSENRIFLRPDGKVVMVAWNHVPTREVLFLGLAVQVIDLDGRTKVPELEAGEQVIETSSKPVFVLGLHEGITRWRMATAFGKTAVPSIFSKPHSNTLKFTNFFPQGVGGSLKIVVPQDSGDEAAGSSGMAASLAVTTAMSAAATTLDTTAGLAAATQLAAGAYPAERESAGLVPDRWALDPQQGSFSLAAGQEFTFPFEVRLKKAYYGKQPIRVDFKVTADEVYSFSVYTEMAVGTDDLTLDVNTHLDKDNNLIIEQLMTNRTDRLADFRCYLYPKGGRRQQRMQVYRLGTSVDRKVYRLPDGKPLIGQDMLLEIEELNGQRYIRYRFIATDEPPKKDEQNAGVGAATGQTATTDVVEPKPGVSHDATSPSS